MRVLYTVAIDVMSYCEMINGRGKKNIESYVTQMRAHLEMFCDFAL